jgi:hypothetical protein
MIDIQAPLYSLAYGAHRNVTIIIIIDQGRHEKKKKYFKKENLCVVNCFQPT